MEELFRNMSNSIFPKGDKDINAVTNELLDILNNKISYEDAKEIVLKSAAISRMSKEFTQERLRQHLAGYCIQHFSNSQVETYHGYLTALSVAMMIHQKTPSDVTREGEGYIW